MQTLLSFVPILILLVCLLVLKLSAMKAGAIALISAVLVSLAIFRPGVEGLTIAMGKGFSLALFVIFIIWGAIFLYNLEKETGALDVINKNIERIVEDRLLRFLLISWVFSAFLQGIAGFGVPVIVATPILMGMGFDPIVSAAAVLVGHSWAISFGSMGSSISAIDLVTETDLLDIVSYMAVFGIVGMVVTGLGVLFIFDGLKGIRRGIVYVLIASVTMGLSLIILAKVGMTSVMGLLSGIVGVITLLVVNGLRNHGKKPEFYRNKLNLFEAFLPYLLIIVLSVAFFVIGPKLKLCLNFPGYVSGTGVLVPAEEAYVSFNILKYPFSIIAMSSLISSVVFVKRGTLNGKIAKNILSGTVKKCTSTTITLVLLLITAQIMMDAGMINNLALFLADVTKGFYPFVAPFIGLLGAFVTGSNTNSNVIFGNLQETAASALGISTAITCAVQSIGASIGGAIGPTTVALGATAAQAVGREPDIYQKTLWPTLIGATALGVTNLILIYLL